MFFFLEENIVDSFVLHFTGPKDEVCLKAIPNANRSLCFLIGCSNNTQNSYCENATNFNNLLAELGVITNGNTSPQFACIFYVSAFNNYIFHLLQVCLYLFHLLTIPLTIICHTDPKQYIVRLNCD